MGQLLAVLQELQFLENAKFTSTKANTNNEEAVARPRPQGKETQHALGVVNLIEYGTLTSNVIMIYLILYKNSQEIRLLIKC